MEVKRRKLHPEQRSTHQDLLANQQRLLWNYWSNDLEIYDDNGELTAITARDNPNLEAILAQFAAGDATPGDPR